MVISSTIFKVALSVADMDRHYYNDHNLTLARHPSETDERLMVRLLAFALNASDALAFTKGISTDDEPDLWEKNLTNEVEHWIELGQPDEKRIRQACGRAKRVSVYCYSGHGAEIWWSQLQSKLDRFGNLSVINLSKDECAPLADLVNRNMQLSATIQDQQLIVSGNDQMFEITPTVWKTV